MATSKFTELLDATPYSVHNVSLEDILAETERRRRSSSSASGSSLPTTTSSANPDMFTHNASLLGRSVTTFKKNRNSKKWDWLGSKSRD